LEELLESDSSESDIYLLPELFNSGYRNAFHIKAEKMGLYTTRWMKQMAEEADLVISESDDDSDSGSAAQSHSQLLTELKNKRKELSKLLARPFKRTAK
jgi:predicted amidohydrolase